MGCLHILTIFFLCITAVWSYQKDKVCGQLYPRAIGGPSGDTIATAHDMSPDGMKIIVGGQTNDSNIIMGNDQYAFLTLFTGQLMQQQWHKIIKVQKSIAVIQFSTDNKTMVLITQQLIDVNYTSPYFEYLIMINNSNGIMMKQVALKTINVPYDRFSLVVYHRITENLIYIQQQTGATIQIRSYSISDQEYNNVSARLNMDFNIIKFDGNPMWMIPSIQTDSDQYQPLIMMGVSQQQYYLFIMQSQDGQRLASTYYQTKSTQIRFQGHVKANKLLSTEEMLIFTRFDDQNGETRIVYTILNLNQQYAAPMERSFYLTSSYNFGNYNLYQNQDLIIINSTHFVTTISGLLNQTEAYIMIFDNTKQYGITVRQASFLNYQFISIYAMKLIDADTYFTFASFSYNKLLKKPDNQSFQNVGFGFFKSHDNASLNFTYTTKDFATYQSFNVIYEQVIDNIMGGELATQQMSISFNPDPPIYDANPKYSQIILQDQVNGPDLLSPLSPAQPQPLTFTVIQGLQFFTQFSLNQMTTSVCNSTEPLTQRYTGLYNYGQYLEQNSTIRITTDTGLITVFADHKNTTAQNITFFVTYSNGQVIGVDYQFKVINVSRLGPKINENGPIYSSYECPQEILIPYTFTDQSNVIIYELVQQQITQVLTFITFQKPNKILIRPTASSAFRQNYQIMVAVIDNAFYQDYIFSNIEVQDYKPPSFGLGNFRQQNDPVILREGDPSGQIVVLNPSIVYSSTIAPNLIILNSDPRLFNYSVTMIEFDQIFEITVEPPCTDYVGVVQFQIKMHLQDSQKCNGTEYQMPVQYQLKPRFNKNYQRFTELHVGQTKTIKLNYQDVNLPPSSIRISLKQFNGIDQFKKFTRFSPKNDQFTMFPVNYQHLGTYEFEIQYINGFYLTNLQPFKITVLRSLPRFIFSQPADQKVVQGDIKVYKLPQFISDDGFVIKVQNFKLPSFIQFNQDTYTFSPNKEFGNFLIQGYLTDSEYQTPFAFTVTVTTPEPPSFESDLKNLKIQINQKFTAQLPQLSQNSSIVTIHEQEKPALPSFAKFNRQNMTLELFPDRVGQYDIIVVLVSLRGMKSIYKFNIETFENETAVYEKVAQQVSNGKPLSVEEYDKQVIQGIVEIRRITQDGRIFVRVNPLEGSLGIIKQFNNDTFSIQQVTEDGNTTNINYELSTIDFENSEIIFQLQIPTSMISSTSQLEPSVLELASVKSIVSEDIDFKISIGKGLKFFKKLQPQLPTNLKSLAKIFDKGRIKIFENNVANFFLSFFVQLIWAQMCDISFMTINMFISMPVPGIASLLQQVFLRIIYKDILYTDLWLPHIFHKKGQKDEETKGINSFFENNGFDSMLLLNNVGSSFVYAVVYASVLIVFQILKRIKVSKLDRFKEKLGSYLEWNFTISLTIDQLPLLILAALINVVELKFSSQLQAVSSVTTISVFLITPVFIISMLKFLYHYDSISDIERLKMSAIVVDINKDMKRAKYWQIVQMIRWIIVTIIMVMFRANYIVQIFSLIFMSMLTQIAIVVIWPFESSFMNAHSLFNEVCVSLYLYIMLILSDFAGVNTLRNECGWALVFLLMIVQLVNLCKFFYNLCVFIRNSRPCIALIRILKTKRTIIPNIAQPENAVVSVAIPIEGEQPTANESMGHHEKLEPVEEVKAKKKKKKRVGKVVKRVRLDRGIKGSKGEEEESDHVPDVQLFRQNQRQLWWQINKFKM